MSGGFVKNPGVQVSDAQVNADSGWDLERFEAALRQAGVTNVSVGMNAQKWFEEVTEAARAGCLSITEYIAVRRDDSGARFCHSAAINLAAAATYAA